MRAIGSIVIRLPQGAVYVQPCIIDKLLFNDKEKNPTKLWISWISIVMLFGLKISVYRCLTVRTLLYIFLVTIE